MSGNALRLVKIGTAGDDFKATADEFSIDRKKLHFCAGLAALDAGSVIPFSGFVNAAAEYESFENPQSGFRSPVLQLNSSADLKAQFSVGTFERAHQRAPFNSAILAPTSQRPLNCGSQPLPRAKVLSRI
ncbi:hypothetical protein [Agrobacterium radiobacter]|uniref:hypothetical protein n=1 Tax=Agrobacterium radiobacter TaxID=362 RepID=UPI0013AF08D4|nr:hypothetical protein [Agrobacterium radiobacter]MBB4321171.1 hypothetical protein [Agrobacterium radiobacter]